MTVSSVFILLIIYTAGNAWATFLPRGSWVKGTRFEFLTPVIVFINPGEFTLKEVSQLVALYKLSSLPSAFCSMLWRHL
jgi:hypothetical protein